MIAIPPINCTAAGVLTANNAVDAAAWAVGTTYGVDDLRSYGGRNWLSLQAANLGKTPSSQPLWWLDSGPINSLAMFDTSVSTATTRTGGLSWTLAVGRFTAIGLMGLVGNSVTITVVDGAVTLFTETRTLRTSKGTYYSFCFETPYQVSDASFTGLLSSPTCQVTVSIAGSAGQLVACGLCVIGKQFFIGHAQYGFNVPIEDRGRFYLDGLGNPVNLERGYSKGVSGSIVAKRADFNRLTSFFAQYIGTPLLWIASPGQNDLVGANVFGRYVRAVPVISDFSHITLALEIAGYR